MENKYELERIKYTTQLPINQGVVVKANTKSNMDWYFWSDQHFGAVECNYPLAEAIIKDIKKSKNPTVTLGGDTIEAIPRGYKISESGQHCTPDIQIARSVTFLKPIAKYINCLFRGNHNTKARGESIDSDFLLAQGLNVPYKTVPTVIQLQLSKNTIRAAGGHGSSGAKNSDTQLHETRKIFPGCDIYFLGHDHSLYAKRMGGLIYNPQGVEHWDEYWFLRTGNGLNYAEYAREKFYTPQASGCVKMVIRDNKIVDGIILTEKSLLKK